MCEIRTTRVSIEHSWNAHGISGFELEAPGVGEGDDEGMFEYYRRGWVWWVGILFT